MGWVNPTFTYLSTMVDAFGPVTVGYGKWKIDRDVTIQMENGSLRKDQVIQQNACNLEKICCLAPPQAPIKVKNFQNSTNQNL